MANALDSLSGEHKRQSKIIDKLKARKRALQNELSTIDLKLEQARTASKDVSDAMEKIQPGSAPKTKTGAA